jgi:regulator of cell morphogenesis and NO signaling
MAATPDTQMTVGQLVTDRPARSRVFGKLGIDFCCGGKKSLDEACRNKGLDPETVLQVILASEQEGDSDKNMVDAAQMTMTQLCDHIEATHHAYLREEFPRLTQMIAKVAAVHGERHPWMKQVHSVFTALIEELAQHMMKEEQILFPIIRKLEAGDVAAAGHCGGTISNPIRMMEHEHDNAGDALKQLHKLTDGYTPPANACNTFRAALDGLSEIENDLHQHIHKENNILFPRELAMEAG